LKVTSPADIEKIELRKDNTRVVMNKSTYSVKGKEAEFNLQYLEKGDHYIYIKTNGYEEFIKQKKIKIAEEKRYNAEKNAEIEETLGAYEKKLDLLEVCDNKHAQAVILKRMLREMQKLNKEGFAKEATNPFGGLTKE
jgi:hypothetical protein